MRFLGVSFGVLLLALAVVAHVGIYRLLIARSVRLARHRRLLAVALVVLAALPTVRVLSSLWPLARPLGQIAMLWHLTVVTAAALTLVGRLLMRAISRLTSRPVAASTLETAVDEASAEAPRLALADAAESPDAGRRDVILASAALTFSTGVYGWGALVGRRDFEVTEVAVKMSRMARALDGFSIVQLSDIHVGPMMDERELGRAVDRANALRPDLIVLTGDIVDAERRFVPVAARALSRLSARFGVVGIPGNHDHYTGLDFVRPGLERAGITMLVNQGKVIAQGDGGIALLGVDDLWSRRFSSGPDLARAQAMVPRELPTILLAHQPPYFDEVREKDIDLQLSGHTHGGQINPGFTPSKLLFHYLAGRYQVGGSTLYVNRGLGVVGPPCRLLAAPEITRLVLTVLPVSSA